MNKYTKPLTLAATVCALAVGGWAYAQSSTGGAGGSPAGDPARSNQNPSQPSGSLSDTPSTSNTPSGAGTMSNPSSTDSTSSPSVPSSSGSMDARSDPSNRMNADTGTSSTANDSTRAARDDRN